MNHIEFYQALSDLRILSSVWEGVLNLLSAELEDQKNKEDILNCFAIYFSLIDDGNICMSLEEKKLLSKWDKKLEDTRVLLSEKEDFDVTKIERVKEASHLSIGKALSLLNERVLPFLFGTNRLFCTQDGWLYAKKYDVARKGVIASIDRLFSNKETAVQVTDYHTFVKSYFQLSRGQEEAVRKGINGSLVITGGPGTGKTTSILFLLMGLLEANPSAIIYLVAPSGKASSRMKESILKGFDSVEEEYQNAHPQLMETIKNLEQSTIHRLLSINPSTNSFIYNKDHRFPENSVFVVDEASMIDICLFDSLLQAIPDSSRIYIMGDKNQLPSVECGAVFGDLLVKPSIKDHIVALDESRRFKNTTKIYELAEAINNGRELPVKAEDWKPYDTFAVEEKVDKNVCPIFYYSCDCEKASQKQIIESVVMKWGEFFYQKLQGMCSDLDASDLENLKKVFDESEKSKILCAENEGPRGVHTINKFVKSKFINNRKQTSVLGFYTGEIMMINKNNKMLDLYNGDSGLLVTFKGDKTLYFMVKKASAIVSEEGKREDKIFKLGDFVFYPFRMISRDEIDEAYAITVHKSQGSDYTQILCILPTTKGHPLLNRQIVYTAITRTKGNTYLISNQERLEEAKDTVLKRDTNIN